MLNEVVPRSEGIGSPRSPDEVRIDPEAAEVVARLRLAGLRTFAVTNQPDVARGLITPAACGVIMDAVRSALHLDDVRVCPHDDADGCACRKPQPGMLRELAGRWDVDLHRSYMVGDGWRDIGAGRAAGCTTVLLRKPYNAEVEADVIVDSLAEAARAILASACAEAARA